MPDQESETLAAGRIETPLGRMNALVDRLGALVYLDFDEPIGPTPPPGECSWRGWPLHWDDGAVAPVARQLGQYFEGRRRLFVLPLAPIGPTFHQIVWTELRTIPYGTTLSYGAMAGRLGRPRAARAVGRANGANPIAVVVPCHRLVGANGRLTGYSGGLARKAALLELESAARRGH